MAPVGVGRLPFKRLCPSHWYLTESFEYTKLQVATEKGHGFETEAGLQMAEMHVGSSLCARFPAQPDRCLISRCTAITKSCTVIRSSLVWIIQVSYSTVIIIPKKISSLQRARTRPPQLLLSHPNAKC